MSEIIKVANFSKRDLGELNWDTGGYIIRYRLVSENRNVTSHWSPQHYLAIDFASNFTWGTVQAIQTTALEDEIVITWNLSEDNSGNPYPTYIFPEYDVFVLYEEEEGYVWKARVTESFYRFTDNPERPFESVKIQVASDKKEIKEQFVIYQGSLELLS